MRTYLSRRILLAVPTLALVSLIVFSLIRLVPGDAAVVMLGDRSYTVEELEALRHELGLDLPMFEQYVTWLGRLLQGDFGRSLHGNAPVATLILLRIPVTLELAVLSLFVASIIGVVVGILSALHRDTPLDYVLRTLAVSGIAMPNWWLGVLVVVFMALWLRWIPPIRYQSLFEDPGANLQQFLIPSIVLGFYLSASLMRMTRSMMLEVWRQDYIQTARAKGLHERAVVYRHALKNALIPVVTMLGIQVPFFLGGTVIVEQIFNLPGIGRLVFDSVLNRDYPTLQAVNLMIAAFILFLNLAVDAIYVVLDPRIRYR